MSIQSVVAYPRETLGKEESKRLRRKGLTPSVVYGLDAGPIPISVEPRSIGKIISSEKGLNSVLNLELEGSGLSRHVMIKVIDRHPVTDKLVHIDFLRIDMDSKVTAMIPIQIEGSPEGVKQGGILTIVRHQVEVECLPKDLPGSIKVDVSGLGIDEALRIKDLPSFDGVELKLGPERTVAVVHAPNIVAEESDEDETEEVDEGEETVEE